MHYSTRWFSTLALCACMTPALANDTDADIYAVKFTADDRYLVTGGSAGGISQQGESFSGGIKIWDAASGGFVKGFGQMSHLDSIFGANYGRLSIAALSINNYRDIVVNGSYPDGRIILLPSSLGQFGAAKSIKAPAFIGGYFNLDSANAQGKRLPMLHGAKGKSSCGNTRAPNDFIGPVVASENGQYAAVVVNTCRTEYREGQPESAKQPQYDSSLFVMDLSRFAVLKYFHKIDTGVYALGIANNGQRVAYVGAQRFAVVDSQIDKRYDIEVYGEESFNLPMQFSALHFSPDNSKLISMQGVYDIETGKEQKFSWKNDKLDMTETKTTSVAIAPDLKHMVLVQQHSPYIRVDEEGKAHVQNKRYDSVVILNVKTGEIKELNVSDADITALGCVTDISSDARKLAVGCSGGLIKMYDLASGDLLWENRNVGYQHKVPRYLMQVQESSAPFVVARSPFDLPAMN